MTRIKWFRIGLVIGLIALLSSGVASADYIKMDTIQDTGEWVSDIGIHPITHDIYVTDINSDKLRVRDPVARRKAIIIGGFQHR
jgi:hypothetical protein